MRLAALTLVATLAAACGGGGASLQVVEPREVPVSSNAPRVSRVVDLGAPAAIPQNGKLSTVASDGKFTVGEHVLVQGSGFGRQPTLLIGGRAAKPIARTADGAILAQIPAGVATGSIEVEVSNLAGKHAQAIDVIRHVAVLQPDAEKLHLLAVAAGGADLRAVGALPIPGAQLVRLSADGAFAYVVASGGVVTVDLTAAGGPKVVHTAKLEIDGVVDAAVGGGRLFVVGTGALQQYSLQEPGSPAPYTPRPWRGEYINDQVVACDVTADGKALALLLAVSDRVVFFDPTDAASPNVFQQVDLLPGQRLPVVRDLRFDQSGRLWVVAGDTPQSAPAGHFGTKLVRLDPQDDGTYAAQPPVEVAGAGPPLAILPSPVPGLASGATIRDTGDDLPIYLTAADARLLPVAGADLAASGAARLDEATRGLAEPGHLVRTNGQGTGGPMPAGEALLIGGPALTPDGTLLVAAAWRLTGGVAAARFGVVVIAAGGEKPGHFVELGPVTPRKLRLPSSLGEATIQP